MKKTAKSEALRIMAQIVGFSARLSPRNFKLDMRFNFNREVVAAMKANALTAQQVDEVRAKRQDRRKRKVQRFKNILQNPLILDYLSNKHQLNHIGPNGLHFYSNRNHWAKDNRDRKILEVLQKHFNPKRN